MKNLLRLAVFIMCIAWLLSLFGCGKGGPQILDGPGMERKLWSAFTISRCNERFEPIYSYTVKYDMDTDEAYLYNGQEKDGVQLRQDTVTELLNLNLLSLPDEEPLDGNFLGLSVVDTQGQAYPKQISGAKEEEILTLLESYLDPSNADGGDDPFMLDGPEMEYQSPWTEFSLSRSDSNAQYTFWFQVKKTEDGALVAGSCRGADGTPYESEEGIPISEEDLWQLRWMNLDQLPDEELWPEDMEMPLDMETVKLTITLTDGTVEKKDASGGLSMEIYQLLLPYFANNA